MVKHADCSVQLKQKGTIQRTCNKGIPFDPTPLTDTLLPQT